MRPRESRLTMGSQLKTAAPMKRREPSTALLKPKRITRCLKLMSERTRQTPSRPMSPLGMVAS